MVKNYSPIVLDSIEPEYFPAVDLYVKQGANYTLYRNGETDLSESGLERLRQSGVEFVYVDGCNSDEVLVYVESNLKHICGNEKISRTSKNLVLSHIMMSDIGEVFKNPSRPGVCAKCRSFLDQHEFFIDDRLDLLELLSKFRHYEVYLFKHSAQVAILAMYMHRKLFGMTPEELVPVGVGAMLHDIGMLDVSYDIHEKRDALTPQEYLRVRHHPRNGHKMLHQIGLSDPVSLSMVLDHHERYNGTGYPRQLYENEIPRSAQIGAISDTYCALTMDRPYRPASTPVEAVKIMRGEKKLYHPGYFEAFADIIGDGE
ncbi:MAG: HD domain-containing phosphohydrolase [Geobacteraceae bacterium]|nr:HD domain-containing phosphohydrolase [Geobacteraceae bacterium]